MEKVSKRSRYLTYIDRVRAIKNWYLFVYPLTRVYTRNRVMRLRGGVKIALRDGNHADYAMIMQTAGKQPWGDGYSLGLIDFAPKRILDAGAHIGIFALIMAKRYPDATVYAVEPDSGNYEQLVKNIALNKLTNVTAVHAALARTEGTVKLYHSDHDAGHSLFDTWARNQTFEEVQGYPLSHFKDINVLKIDTEGAEFEIIPPLPDSRHVIIEIHPIPGKDTAELAGRFAERYAMLWHKERVWVFGKKAELR